MATRRTQEEIQALLEGYKQRTVTRVEFCRQRGIAKSTLGYYVRRYGRKTKRFVRVKIAAQGADSATPFALVLCNGRRIESAWNFRDADLARLIRVVEAE